MRFQFLSRILASIHFLHHGKRLSQFQYILGFFHNSKPLVQNINQGPKNTVSGPTSRVRDALVLRLRVYFILIFFIYRSILTILYRSIYMSLDIG